MTEEDEAARLEALWSGVFGDRYVERNLAAGEGRDPFWQQTLDLLEVDTVLEVGCNIGANLRWIAGRLGPEHTFGVDVNEKALAQVREQLPGVRVQRAVARELPFDDGAFDLVFTTGVLIHQPPAELEAVMREIVRCSRRYVLCGEYHAAEPEEVPYHGERGALFKRDFGGRYRELFPELRLVDERFLPASEGVWDDLTVWTFEKP